MRGNRWRRRHFLAILLALAAQGRARAASFSDIYPGARPMGMGYAYTSVADDLYAMFFNPAGLAGADFTQMTTGLGRTFSPLGPLSYETFAYSRPFTPRPNSTFGAAFWTLSQANTSGNKTQFLLHYSEPMKIPELFLTRPVKLGANAKVIHVHGSKGEKNTIGADAGLQLDSGSGLKGGLAVLDLSPDVGVPQPTLAVGASYLLNQWLLFAADMRVRSSLTQFFPGLEASFFQGLLKGRIGKAMPVDGENGVSLGAGFNVSPFVVDFAMTVPWRGFNRAGGAYEASVSYRFGAPPFYGRFVGTAARQAEELKQELLDLEDRRRGAEAAAKAAEAGRDSLQGQVTSLENREKALQEQLNRVEYQIDVKRFEKSRTAPPPQPAPKPAPASPEARRPAPTPFPRKHAVKTGDTLRSISKDQYGDPNLWELIYNANPEKVERGLPLEGTVLTIPSPNGAKAPAGAEGENP